MIRRKQVELARHALRRVKAAQKKGFVDTPYATAAEQRASTYDLILSLERTLRRLGASHD